MTTHAAWRALGAFGLVWIALLVVAPGRGVVAVQAAALPGALRREAWIGALAGTALILVNLALRLGPGQAALQREGRFLWPAFVAGLLFTAFLVLTEEMTLRGLLLGRLRGAAGPTLAVILTALVFAALHFFGRALVWSRGLEYLLDGLLLGLLTLRTGSIWAAFAWHLAKNVGVAEVFGAGSYRLREPLFRLVQPAGAAPCLSESVIDLLAFAASVAVAAALLAVWPQGRET